LAQDDEFKTIFKEKDGNNLRITGFGGPMMAFTFVGDDFIHMMGGGGGAIIGNAFFGGYGCGSTNAPAFKYDDQYTMKFGHGGLWFGYIFGFNRPVHLSLSAQTGWGNITQRIKLGEDEFEDVQKNSVFVLTPIAELEFNFSRFFVLGLGTSISYVSGTGISNTPYTANDFLKPSLYLTFKFGWFQ
jgi:hypothetical protein